MKLSNKISIINVIRIYIQREALKTKILLVDGKYRVDNFLSSPFDWTTSCKHAKNVKAISNEQKILPTH